MTQLEAVSPKGVELLLKDKSCVGIGTTNVTSQPSGLRCVRGEARRGELGSGKAQR